MKKSVVIALVVLWWLVSTGYATNFSVVFFIERFVINSLMLLAVLNYYLNKGE